MRLTLKLYLIAAAFSFAFGAGVGFAADIDGPPSDPSPAASGPPASLMTPIAVEPATEPAAAEPPPSQSEETTPQSSNLQPDVTSQNKTPLPEANTVAQAPAQAVVAAQAEPQSAQGDVAAQPEPLTVRINPGYHLGAGDKVRVTVYGETDLSGEFQVDGSGFVRLPLIGQVQAAGRSVHEFEGDVAAKLSEGYLRAPRVSAEVVNYRPFFILGEVNKPGEYPYVNGMNVVTAVALAGGFTYRADESDVYIRRNDQPEKEFSADEKTPVLPGDIIRVTERFF